MVGIKGVRGEVCGAIFDVDDTLLDNGSHTDPTLGLHAQSRLAAVYEAADKYDLPALATLTSEENVRAFMTAKTHSLAGAVWSVLFMKGIVGSDEIDPTNPLLNEIVDRKNVLHEAILREKGVEVAGASKFIKDLALSGLAGKLAIASSAVRRDIDIFLAKYDLTDLFPEANIISLEKVSHAKPDPEAFNLAFDSLGLPDNTRRNVLAFEDDPRGVQSAKRAGLFVCAITTRYQRNDAQLLAAEPDVIADTYLEFDALIRR